MNSRITTARIPVETRNKLFALARIKNKTKSDIIKESLDMYYEQEEDELDSFAIGEPFFGRYGSGEKDRATGYKKRIKGKIARKLSLERKSEC